MSIGVALLAINILLRHKYMEAYTWLGRPGPGTDDPLYVCRLKNKRDSQRRASHTLRAPAPWLHSACPSHTLGAQAPRVHP